jgi:hypothetical protein
MHQLNFDKIKSYTAYPDGGATIEYKGGKKEEHKTAKLGFTTKNGGMFSQQYSTMTFTGRTLMENYKKK